MRKFALQGRCLDALARKNVMIQSRSTAHKERDYEQQQAGFAYTFDGYAEIMNRFAVALELTRYALYLHDYGSQIGLRLAIMAPARVAALIIQNGDVYEQISGLPPRASAANADRLGSPGWLHARRLGAPYLRDLPKAELHLLDGGHWALETNLAEIVAFVRDFLGRVYT
jgi:hypothetical protein